MHKKSPHLTALLQHWNKPRRQTKADKELIRAMTDYPHNSREAVFCWLWVNYDGVHELIHKWQCAWDGVAGIMVLDGIMGSRGAPPTGNAVRRVWGRVCREMEARQAGRRQDGRTA